jgi:hypothetical protein
VQSKIKKMLCANLFWDSRGRVIPHAQRLRDAGSPAMGSVYEKDFHFADNEDIAGDPSPR